MHDTPPPQSLLTDSQGLAGWWPAAAGCPRRRPQPALLFRRGSFHVLGGHDTPPGSSELHQIAARSHPCLDWCAALQCHCTPAPPATHTLPDTFCCDCLLSRRQCLCICFLLFPLCQPPPPLSLSLPLSLFVSPLSACQYHCLRCWRRPDHHRPAATNVQLQRRAKGRCPWQH